MNSKSASVSFFLNLNSLRYEDWILVSMIAINDENCGRDDYYFLDGTYNEDEDDNDELT